MAGEAATALGWGWRAVRWDDLDGSAVVLRTLSGEGEGGGEAVVQAVVCDGALAGSVLHWGSVKGVVGREGMPPWLCEELAGNGGSMAGRARGARRVGLERRELVAAVDFARARVGGAGGEVVAGVDVVVRAREVETVLEQQASGEVQYVERAVAGAGKGRGEAAAWAAGQGWGVFALAPGSKATHRGSGGYRDAVAGWDVVEDLRAYWADWPGDNLALACGLGSRWASPVVLDVDPKNGGSMRAVCEYFEVDLRVGENFVVQTPSGGVHVYFWDEQIELTKRTETDGVWVGAAPSVMTGGFAGLDGVELKASGTHVVMPTSVLAGGGEYRRAAGSGDRVGVLPESVRQKAHDARLTKADLFGLPPSAGVPVDLVLASLRSAPEGKRNTYAHACARELCRTLRFDGAARRDGLLALRGIAVEIGLGVGEVDRAIESAARFVKAEASGS